MILKALSGIKRNTLNTSKKMEPVSPSLFIKGLS